MAAIGQIRKHSGLLILIIGSALLLFLLGGVLESSTIFFNGPNNEVGEINGTTISYQEFDQKVAVVESNSRNTLSDQDRQRIREQVWNDILRTQILGKEYQSLGLSVSDEELLDIIKNDPNNPMLKQYFSDPQTGQIVPQYANGKGGINGNAVIQYLKQVVYADNENSTEALASWNNFQENYVRKPALDNKYSTLLAKSIYVTDLELDQENYNNNSRISFVYTSTFYNDLPDEDVEVTESEIKAYYNKNKNNPLFQQKERAASIKFVSFEVTPSEEDKLNLLAELVDLKEAFKNTTSDTAFINENGDQPFNIRWATKGMFPQPYDSIINNSAQGTVIDPFQNGNKYELVKILETKMGPDSVKASHILIQNPISQEAGLATADSLKAVALAQNNFADLATQYSKDPGSAAKGGDLGWFTEGKMVPEFNDACFNGKTGDLVIVTTQFGVHLIKIDEQTKPIQKVKVGIIVNNIEASQATYELAYNTASTFAITNNSTDKFETAAAEMNSLDAPNLGVNNMTIMGKPNTRQVVRWAFESEVGDVSPAFDLGNEFMVAMVTEKREKGVLPLELVSDIAKAEVIKEKKAELLMKKMEGTDIKSIARANEAGVETVPELSFGSFSIPGLGNELELIGQAYSLNQGQTSLPIKGERGVYVIMVENKVEPTDSEINEGMRKGLMSAYQGRVTNASFTALKNNANITDNRYTFF